MNKGANLLSHRGYTGTVEASVEDECLIGRVLHIHDIITYEGETIPQIKAAFEEAVDDYIVHCESIGKQPNKPYSGSLNVRIGAERHRLVAEAAAARNASINDTLNHIIDEHFRPAVRSNMIRMHVLNELRPMTAASSSEALRFLFSASQGTIHEQFGPITSH